MSAVSPFEVDASKLFDHARKIADAVLYEGYVLYPYRASARKNQLRWQFGVLAPRDWSLAGGCEEWWAQTECLLEVAVSGQLIGRVRFLQVQQRTVEESVDADGETFRAVPSLEVEGRLWTAWQEGIERELEFYVPILELLLEERILKFSFEGSRDAEIIQTSDGRRAGRVLREQSPIDIDVRLAFEAVPAISTLLKLSVRVENVTPCSDSQADRESALSQFLVGTHAMLGCPGAKFLSLSDPPEWARAAAASCVNSRSWPVLIGKRDGCEAVLASPIILDDYPEIAPESAGDLCDATEIDEILLLRTLTLTDEEKREARATDARAAAIIDRADNMPREMLERLHGTIRSLRHVPSGDETEPPTAPWWDPGADASVSPETDSIEVRGVSIAKGNHVRLRPGERRADAQDMFLAGRTAVVEGVFVDVDDRHYVAVTLADDPAADLHQWHGRFFYFDPEEIEPLEKET